MSFPELIKLLGPVIPALATLIAATGGCLLGYRLNLRREQQRLYESRAAAGNKALFVLTQQLNRLQNIRNQFIDPVRERFGRALEIQPVLSQGMPLMIEMDSLAFLLELKEADMCMRLVLEQDKYEIAQAVIKERSRIHLDEVQPKLEHAGFKEGEPYTIAQIEQMLGTRLLARIVRATDLMIVSVDAAIASNVPLVADLWLVMKEQFPKHKFVKVN